jgi:hypothetical protein
MCRSIYILCNFFCRLMVLFLISVYFGGEITLTSQSGADYTLDPKLTLSDNENITFEEVKYGIF